MAKIKDRSTRISSDPGRKVPKEELDDLPSIFVDREKLKKISDEVSAKDQAMLPFTSDHVMRGVIHLAALSIPSPVIGRSLNIPVRRVNSILSSESVIREVERIQVEHYKRDADQMFKRLVPTAVQNIFDLMVKKSSKESTRLSAAQYIVDRALGKPKETIEQKTDMIAEVFSSLKRKEEPQPDSIEVEFSDVIDDSCPLDPLEGLLK